MNWNSNNKTRLEEKIAVTIIILMLLSISISIFVYEPKLDPQPLTFQSEESDIEYEKIDPIKVEGNDGFSDEYWEGNGTEENPYRLKESYEIDASGHEYGIKMDSITENHFIIEDTEIYGASGDPGAGIIFHKVANGEIRNSSLYGNDNGIQAQNIAVYDGNKIEDNQIINNNVGIYYVDSSGDIIKNNYISNNDRSGFYGYEYVNKIKIIGNNISNNGFTGIEFEDFSPNNLIKRNILCGNDGPGIYLNNSLDNTQITENEIKNNEYGIKIENSFDNQIWRNQFIDNAVQAEDDHDNEWNRGDPAEGGEGGNYWSDHDLEDRHDNIGKNPYEIAGGDNKDNYPWLTPEMVRHLVDRFEFSVDNITAGEAPEINVSEAYNVEDHRLEGLYEFEIDMGNQTELDNLTFESGNTTTFGATIEDRGEKTMYISADGVTDSDIFYVETADPNTINLSADAETTIKAGKSLEFTAEVLDKYDNLISHDEEDFIWENATKGTFNKNTTGHYNVTANFEDEIISEHIKVTVEPAEVNSVELTALSDTNIIAGETLEFRAEAYDEYNNLITNYNGDFGWENASYGNFDNTTAGEYEVKAIYKTNNTSITDTVNITVEADSVHSIQLKEPSKTNITAGKRIELTAKTYDQYDNIIHTDSNEFEWENASDGNFNKTITGKYKVTATFEDEIVSEPINITVEPAEAYSIKLKEPQEKNITAGNTLKFHATASDQYGNLLTDNPKNFDWQNALNGTFNKTEVGKYEVRVTYQDNENLTSKPVNVTVKPGNPNLVELIEPSETTITAGETLEFQAKVYDRYDNLIADENQNFNWKNASNGTFEETTAGSYEVSATYQEDKVSSETTTVVVQASSLNNFELKVEDLSTGERPKIEIVHMKDRYGNRLRGEYEVKMEINDDSKRVNLNFTAGSASYEWNKMVTADQYSIEVEIHDISKSDDFQVVPSNADSIEIEPREKTIYSTESVIYRSTAYDEWNNRIGEVTERTNWHIPDDAGGNWDYNEYEAENQGTWNITAIYTYDEKNLTDNTVLTVKQEVEEFFEYSGLNTIIFEENLDYELEWDASENNTISYYELFAGNSSEKLEKIETSLKNESYQYRFEDGEIIYFKIIGYQEDERKVESINFTVKVDLIEFNIEKRENRIFTVNIPEERRDDVNVTWSVNNELKGDGEVFIPALEVGEYNITAEVSSQDHTVERTFEIYLEESEEKEDLSIIYIIGGIGILFLIFILIYLKSKKDSDEKETFSFSEEKGSGNRLEKDSTTDENEGQSTSKSEKPSPGISTQPSDSPSSSSNEVIDEEILVQIFEDIEKATKKEVYAEFTGKSRKNIELKKLEEKIQSLVQEERVTMEPRKGEDTKYIWNDIGSQPN